MARNYNFIYEKLVTNEQDVVGHVAYALYKSSKIEYIEKYKQEHNGQTPSESDLKPFHDISCTQSSIDRYRTKALEITGNFLDITLSESIKQIEHDLMTDQEQRLKGIIEPMKPASKWRRFWSGVFQSVLGAFFFAIIVAAFVFITTNNKEDDGVKAGIRLDQVISPKNPLPNDTLR